MILCLAPPLGRPPGTVCGVRLPTVSEIVTHLVDAHQMPVGQASRTGRSFADLASREPITEAPVPLPDRPAPARVLDTLTAEAQRRQQTRAVNTRGFVVRHCRTCGEAGHYASTCGRDERGSWWNR